MIKLQEVAVTKAKEKYDEEIGELKYEGTNIKFWIRT